MDIENFQVDLPNEFLPYVDLLIGANLEEKIKISVAMNLFLEALVPLEVAVKLSGQSLGHFIELFRLMMTPWAEALEEPINKPLRKYKAD